MTKIISNDNLPCRTVHDSFIALNIEMYGFYAQKTKKNAKKGLSSLDEEGQDVNWMSWNFAWIHYTS